MLETRLSRWLSFVYSMSQTLQDTSQHVAVTQAVVRSVAESADVDPLALDPLHDSIDTNALRALFTSEGEGHLQFTYADHDVVVYSDGEFTVRPLA